MEHQHLDMNHAQGYQPRVTNKAMLKKLVQTAFKHIPGGAEAIKEHFPSGNVVDTHKLFPPKPKNLKYHLGW